MKNLYKVLIGRMDACEGKTVWNDEEYVLTENVNAYVEAKKAEIEARDYWWMDHRKEEGRPLVKAERLNVVEA